MNKFFEENLQALKSFIKIVDNTSFKEKELPYTSLIISVFEEMIERSRGVNDSFNSCTFNIENIGNSFISNISDSNPTDKWGLIVSDTVRFCKELELRSDVYIDSVHDLIFNVSKDIFNSEPIERNKQINYALSKMPLIIMEDIYSKKYIAFKDNIHNEVDSIIEEKLPSKQEAIEKLNIDNDKYISLLKGFKQEFSFLALNQSFHKLEITKQKQLKSISFYLKLLGLLIVMTPLLFHFFSITEYTNIEQSISKLIPLIFVESIFIYYFKIILNKYNSISDQIVQLETKQSVMQFIESYVDYKKDKGLSNDDLSKFEDIIFSQISPNLKDIPVSPDIVSLFDGVSKAVRRK